MTDDEKTTTSEAPTATPRRGGPLGRLWAFLGPRGTFHRAKVPMGLIEVAAVVFVAVVIAGNARTVTLDSNQREADRQRVLSAIWTQQLLDYTDAVNDHEACLESVARSDLNRGQHEATVLAFEALKAQFPDSSAVAAGVDTIVTMLKAGPLLSAEPRDVAECGALPTYPTPPDGYVPPELPLQGGAP